MVEVIKKLFERVFCVQGIGALVLLSIFFQVSSPLYGFSGHTSTVSSSVEVETVLPSQGDPHPEDLEAEFLCFEVCRDCFHNVTSVSAFSFLPTYRWNDQKQTSSLPFSFIPPLYKPPELVA